MDITSYIEFVRLFSNKTKNVEFFRNYHTLRTMHVRGDQNPNHNVRYPLTTTQEGKI